MYREWITPQENSMLPSYEVVYPNLKQIIECAYCCALFSKL